MKILSKKLYREVWYNKSQFLTVFLMVFIGVLVFSGIHAYMDGMDKYSNEFYENNNLQDLWMTGENFTQDDLEKVKSLENVNDAERKLTVSTKVKDSDVDIELNFIESNNISKFYVVDGETYDNQKDGIWIDSYVAENQGYKVGQKITLKYEGYEIEKTILGLINTPDHVYATRDDTEIFPNHKTFGYAYTSINSFPEEYIIDNIMKEANISSRDVFDMYFKDFDASEYYVFPYIMVDVKDTSKINETKADIENNVESAIAVTDRDACSSYAGFKSEVEEGQTYAPIFTGLFLFIAILSVITTMHRFIQKQRTQIGTLKALGFKRSRITRHYVCYGLFISLIAAVLGIVVGGYTLGVFFINMEKSYFEVPNMTFVIKPVVFYLALAVVFAITLVTYITCRSILNESASEALRVQMPKVKNSKLNITDFWLFKKASISTKWNIRDIFRNKGRSLMAIVGVVGCTMLLVCATGMLDTMNKYLNWQFSDLSNFNYKLSLNSNYTQDELDSIIQKYGENTTETLGIEIKNGDVKKTNTITINDSNDKVRVCDHKFNYIKLKDNGIYITEKLAKTLGVSVGDKIEWHIFGSDKWYTSEIVGLNRDPQSQSITASKKYFESLDLEYKPDSVYTDCDLNGVEKIDGVTSIQNVDSIRSGMESMLKTMQMMIFIFIAFAAILGFVIIYNLGILSLTEKQYQFATLKVLGFKSKQIKKIFTIQNVWLAIVGTIIGLPAGYYMIKIIFTKALSENYDMPITVKLVSYVYAAVGAILVTYFVNRVLSKKINKIDMVSSLKVNE